MVKVRLVMEHKRRQPDGLPAGRRREAVASAGDRHRFMRRRLYSPVDQRGDSA